MQSEKVKLKRKVVRSMLEEFSSKSLLKEIETSYSSLMSWRKTNSLKRWSYIFINALCQPGGKSVREAILRSFDVEKEGVVE